LEKIFKIGDDILIYPNIEELAYILKKISTSEAKAIAANGINAVSKLSYQKVFKRLLT
jgi:spore maturation protein CgeB